MISSGNNTLCEFKIPPKCSRISGIDDNTGKTVVSASSISKDFSAKGNKSEQSKAVGKAVAEKALAAGIKQVVFDRNGYLYHGRVQSLAEGAREAGLNF